MKHLYLIVFFLVSSLAFGQTNPNSEEIDGFKLYPNPATNGRVHISTALNAPKKILIFDIFGSLVLETTIVGTELNISKLDAGVYMLRVNEGNRIATRKLVVK